MQTLLSVHKEFEIEPTIPSQFFSQGFSPHAIYQRNALCYWNPFLKWNSYTYFSIHFLIISVGKPSDKLYQHFDRSTERSNLTLYRQKSNLFLIFILETNIDIKKILTHQWFDLWVCISNNLHHFQIFGKQFS